MRLRHTLLIFSFLLLTASATAQNATVTSIDDNTRITNVNWEGQRVDIIIDSDIPRMVTAIDIGAFTGSGVSRIEPKRVRLTAGRSTNVSMKTTPSGIGRGVSLSVGNYVVPIKKDSGGILPEASKKHVVIGTATGGAISFALALVWVRREKSLGEDSMRRIL